MSNPGPDLLLGVSPRFPDEVWREVFLELGNPTALLSCILTCKRFRDIAEPELYRTIQYHSSASCSTLRSSSFTGRDPNNLQYILRSVKGIVLGSGHSDRELWFNDNERRPSFTLLASFPNRDQFDEYEVKALWITSFYPSFASNITKLVLVTVHLPKPQLAPALIALTGLRQLYIYGCKLEDVGSATRRAAVEARMRNLTDLRIWRHSSWYHKALAPAAQPAGATTTTNTWPVITVDLLFATRSLHTLYIDWTASVAYPLIGRITPVQTAFLTEAVPHLRILHVRCSIRFAKPDGEDGHRDVARLGQFLRACTSLEELHLVNANHISDFAQYMGYVGLTNLRVYLGPVAFLPLLLSPDASGLESVIITGIPEPRVDDRTHEAVPQREPDDEVLSRAFSQQRARNLQHLSFFCSQWHKEILACVSTCSPQLKTLKVGYSSGGIAENDWLAMGGLYLKKLPQLSTFYLYKVEKTQPQSNQERTEGLVPKEGEPLLAEVFAAWKDTAPLLDEVSFDPCTVWMRSKVAEGRKVYDEDVATNDLHYRRQSSAWSEWRMHKLSRKENPSVTLDKLALDRAIAEDREADLWLA
ncbi:hypothetical protein PM082_021785 [Marasmius tenuissimus]|nr:hypothetical protein PM082_021785 [Marasmius tenuissimus]